MLNYLLLEYTFLSYFIGGLFFIWLVLKSFKKLKRKKTWLVLILLSFTLSIGSFWVMFIEPNLITINTQNINLNKTLKNENIKIVFISDLHANLFKNKNFFQKVSQKILNLKPDLVLLGGDYIVENKNSVKHLAPLKTFSQKIPTFAILGNHEYNLGDELGEIKFFNLCLNKLKNKTEPLRKLFKTLNITILENENQQLTINNQKLYILGLQEIWTKKHDLNKALENTEKNLAKILLVHNPDFILNPDHKKVDLILSGHTHGGQMRLPKLGSIKGIPNQLGKKFDQGLFKLEDNFLFVSSGIGESGANLRLFNLPEIVLINLNL